MSIFDQPFKSSPSCFGLQSHEVFSSNHPQELRIRQDEFTAAEQKQKQEMDALLSQALNALTFEERQEQQEILHGVDDLIIEESGFIDRSIQQLQAHLKSLKAGTMYEFAESMDPGYVKARPFRVMFLRGNRYDTRAAAEQMIRFFDVKHELFGIEKLVKDITIEDLDEDDIACLKTGSIQLAGKDSSGRQVFIQFPGLIKSKKLESQLRALYYASMSVLKSEESQLRGTVSIVYSIGKFKDRSEGKGHYEATRLAMSIPLHKAAIHICSEGAAISEYLVHSCIIRVLPVKLRARCRLHYGSRTECQYRLSTYGILPTSLPLESSSNSIVLDRHIRWVKSCTIEDMLSSISPRPFDSNATPKQVDVLFTGTRNSSHVGNQNFRELVLEFADSYDFGTCQTKRIVVGDVIAAIHRSGGRFLKHQHRHNAGGDSRGWREVPLDELRKKIMQAFRNRRRRRRGASNMGS